LRKSLPWIVAALVVLAIGISFVLLSSALRMQRQTSDEIHRHFENVLALRHAQALLVDAETGQRGFLLTGEASFLDPYSRARAQLPSELRGLGNIGIDGPGARLQQIASAKLDELDLTLRLARSGQKPAALARVAEGTGKRLMDSYRRETERLVDAQQAQLDDALRRSEAYTVRTYVALGLLMLSAGAVLLLGGALVLRTRRLEAEAVRLREVEQAERQTALIARELNHRVKNLFSVVIAIVQLASRGSTSPKEAVSRIRERVEALARAHEVSLGADPMSGFDLEGLLRTILAPYASNSAELELSGPAIQLPAMRVTPIGLIVHELATNAMKYGAWSMDGGKVSLRWSVGDATRVNDSPTAHILRLQWDETRSHPLEAEGASGFGSRMIGAAVAQLDGSFSKERGDHGLSIVIDAPIIPAQLGKGESDDQ
jgi:two-component sensor histidine kinase